MDSPDAYESSGQMDGGNFSLNMTFPWSPPSLQLSSSPYPDPGVDPGRNGGSNGGGHEQVTLVYIAIFSCLFFAIATVGICGNAMVIYIILSDKKMRG
ncbi:somatostatin receptor type 1 [Plakobranchus ocellatus]|uniref:Somatostatin receptor type 1 n=1 Tax=Plakobranchus ocellatus TaxID=259542 RepID=A0AAV4BVP8_9GAST|nr:somatostatin receptor type 1 [Plakobranchus ocellatus]